MTKNEYKDKWRCMGWKATPDDKITNKSRNLDSFKDQVAWEAGGWKSFNEYANWLMGQDMYHVVWSAVEKAAELYADSRYYDGYSQGSHESKTPGRKNITDLS
jgi:hypothetical protein